MREVIRKVIETEAAAKHLLEAAKAEAERLREVARKQGQDLVARRRLETRVEAEKIVETAVQEAGREKLECLGRVAAEIESQVGLDEATRQRAIKGILQCVCGFG